MARSPLWRGARTLNISHPTVGRRIRALEEATGYALFQRTAAGFVLTNEGNGIVALAERMKESALVMDGGLLERNGKSGGACASSQPVGLAPTSCRRLWPTTPGSILAWTSKS
ncbi:LysR family transcriptional regulator [Skermanella stibiiresistens]|uniref:LysR family transcriptional regulator n=1 Tax=Skermanella stibiiresistens TaxID=913326 RepID=UPI001FE1AE9D|nr:LysR family transcriptional regulator [Skermanella stibiiresistens]